MNVTPALSAVGELAASVGPGPGILIVILLLSIRALPVAMATVVLSWCTLTGRRPGRAGDLLIDLVRLTRRDR